MRKKAILFLIILSVWFGLQAKDLTIFQIITKTKTVTIKEADLAKVKSVTIQSKRDIPVKCYKLSDILTFYKLSFKSVKEITAVSYDGATSELDSKKQETVYLGLHKEKDEIFWRLVYPEDKFNQSWQKYIKEIKIK